MSILRTCARPMPASMFRYGGAHALAEPENVAPAADPVVRSLADLLRVNSEAVDFIQSFFAAGKPVAVICHGPWTLIEAGVLSGRTLTSWPSLRTVLLNAGATKALIEHLGS